MNLRSVRRRLRLIVSSQSRAMQRPARLRTDPLTGSPFSVTSYAWSGRTLRFVTDAAADTYTSYIRDSFWVETPVLFAARWLAGSGACIDVGANLGAFTVPLAARGSPVLAIEPLPRNAELLAASIRENGFARATLIHAAAGDAEGLTRIAGTSAWGRVVDEGGFEVPLVTVDALRERLAFPPPALVKIDVEGYERHVLRGMASTIRAHRPLIIIESNAWAARGEGHTYHDLLADLEAHGYHLYLIAHFLLVPRTARDMQEACVADYVAAPAPLKGRYGPFEVLRRTHGAIMQSLARDIDAGIEHRWHIATMLREYPALFEHDPRTPDLRRRLAAYGEPLVLGLLDEPAPGPR